MSRWPYEPTIPRPVFDAEIDAAIAAKGHLYRDGAIQSARLSASTRAPRDDRQAALEIERDKLGFDAIQPGSAFDDPIRNSAYLNKPQRKPYIPLGCDQQGRYPSASDAAESCDAARAHREVLAAGVACCDSSPGLVRSAGRRYRGLWHDLLAAARAAVREWRRCRWLRGGWRNPDDCPF